MTASLRLRESFCLVTPTVGLIAWSLLPSQQFHISCHSLRISSLARGRKSMTDILTVDIGSDRADFATPSALSFPGISTWPGIQQSINVLPEFVRVLYVLKIFRPINCAVVNVTSSQRNQTWIWVWQQEKMCFFTSSDNVHGKQNSVKFRTEDACCTRQSNRWCPAFIAEDCRNSVGHFTTIGIDLRTTSRARKIAWSSALKMLVAPNSRMSPKAQIPLGSPRLDSTLHDSTRSTL